MDLGRGPDVAADAADRAHIAGLAVLAERVDTEAAARFCAAHGVDLLQGPLFPRDTTPRARDLSAGQLQCLELMQLLSADPVDYTAVIAMVAADPELSMRVLRLVNVSALAVRREIDSVRQAVVLVGPAHLSALAVSALLDARVATVGPLWFTLARAGACRALGRHDNAYTVGLLSAVAAQLCLTRSSSCGGRACPTTSRRRCGTGPARGDRRWPRSSRTRPTTRDAVAATGLRPADVSDAYLDAVTAAFGTASSLAGVV